MFHDPRWLEIILFSTRSERECSKQASYIDIVFNFMFIRMTGIV
jgi:hypothetical protein